MEPCVFFNIRRVDRMVSQVYGRIMGDCGLKPTQFTLLRVLSFTGEITVSALAETANTDRTTLTRNLKLLENEGWIRTKAGKDRRTRYIILTLEGSNKLEQALPYWEEAQKQIMESYGRDNWESLLSGLRKMLDTAKALS